ncbi:MAG: ATP-binding protein [Myxococcota bacterium]
MERTQRELRLQRALYELARSDKSRLDTTLRFITETDARALDVERVGVWFFDDNRSAIRCHDCFRLQPGQHLAGTQLLAREYPRYFHALEEQRTLAAHDAVHDDRTREFADAYLRPNAITSMLDVPVWRGGKMVGIVCHEHVGLPRVWTLDEQDFAASVADMVSLALEASERARAEAEREQLLVQLGEERQRLEQVLRQLPSGVVIGDRATHRVVFANAASEQIWQRPFTPGQDLDTYRLGDIRRPGGQSYGAGELPLARATRTGEMIVREELQLRRGDGTWACCEVNAAPIRDAQGQIVAGVVAYTDITDRKQMERQLEEAARMRERFMGILGHDLRTPLTVILMCTHLLQRMAVDAERPLLQRIEANARRMERLVRDLLDLTRIRAGGIPVVPKAMNLVESCHAVVEEARAAHPGQEIRLEVEGDCHGVWDPDRLTQVVSNLVSNALNHGLPGGRISVVLHGEATSVVLEVHNEGAPIPPTLLPHLFEPFRRAREPAPSSADSGLGLGLYIVREIVQAHGGEVSVRSSAEAGTTFTVRLPRRAEHRPGPREARHPLTV